MKTLLHIEASPRKTRSHSLAVARHAADAWSAAHPGGTVRTLDLWSTVLPPFDGETIDAKYAILHGQAHTPAQAAAWERIRSLAEEFKAADGYILSTPMWNFGVPYILKHYFDLIIQPGLTFSYSPESGYTGLVTGKKALVVAARGGAYGPGSGAESYDLQTATVRQLFGFIGVTEVSEVLVEPTLAPDAARDAALATARERAADAARTL